MVNWELLIRKVDKGFVVRRLEELDGKEDDTSIEEKSIVFQERDENMESLENDLESVRDMLYYVLEYFGIFHSKHNEKNIKIEVETNDNKNE